VALIATGVMSVGILGLVSVNWTSARLPTGLAQLTANVQTHFRSKNAFDRLGLWARAHAPPDAVFIVPPYTESFRLVAERAIVVDFKTFAAQGPDVLEWRHRLDDLSSGRSLTLGDAWYTQLREAYTQLSPEQFAGLGQKYGARYAVVERSQAPLGNFAAVYENEGYVLYDLSPKFFSCPDDSETAADTGRGFLMLTLLDVGCLDSSGAYVVPVRWLGAETVEMQDLLHAAPPLSVTGYRGDFVFHHTSTETGDVIRVSPVASETSQDGLVIQFGPWPA